MFSHVTVGISNIARSRQFYDAILAALGLQLTYSDDEVAAYGDGSDESAQFWLLPPFDGKAQSSGNGNHVAFNAPSRSSVDKFHAEALANGGTDEGPPGLRPQYHEHYYGAYVRDPDGNKLQAVCHSPD